jgi:hypothetical protein
MTSPKKVAIPLSKHQFENAKGINLFVFDARDNARKLLFDSSYLSPLTVAIP